MSENQLLAAIANTPALRRKFHRLSLSSRRLALELIAGNSDEKVIIGAIKKAKRMEKSSI